MVNLNVIIMTYHNSSQRSSVSGPLGHQVISLYAVLFTLTLILQFAEGQLLPFDITGTLCGWRCDENRPKGHRESFKFNCQNKDDCLSVCKSCPKQVCDETISSSDWHCPSTDISQECSDVCNARRENGQRKAYNLNCTDETCNKNCGKCPHFVCDPGESNPRVFHCPWDNFQGPCRLECDKARVKGVSSKDISFVKTFQLRCAKEHSSDKTAYNLCVDTCVTHCPAYVCTSLNKDFYQCPSAELNNGPCKQFCDERAGLKREAHTVNCISVLQANGTSGAAAKCQALCKTCRVPGGINFVCDENIGDVFLCPEPGPDNPIPKGQRSFKGICGDKCKASRGGGFQAYNLSCEDDRLYSTPQERLLCKQVCTQECPEQACRITPPSGTTQIECPADKDQIKKMEDEALKKELEFHRDVGYYNRRKEELIIYICILAGLVTFISVCFCCYCAKMKRNLKQAQAGQQSGGGNAPQAVTESRMRLQQLQQHHSSGHSGGVSPQPQQHPHHHQPPHQSTHRLPSPPVGN